MGLNQETHFAYDNMNRLIKANYNERTESFTYDLVGNRLSHTVNDDNTTFIYNTKNQLTQLSKDIGITNFTYDAQGNILKESTPQGTNSFSYNALNQQRKAVTYQGNTLINRYDAEGLRAEIEENQKLARFIFHRDEILVETDGEDKAVSRLIRGYNVVAGDIISEASSGLNEENSSIDCGLGRYYYQLDEQFSTDFITNQAQKVVNSYTYDAFGNTLESEEQVHNRIKYTGQQYDAITQQYYLRARFYNPILGRFMQEDVYRGDGLNLYAYCSNNPVMYYDPSGYAISPASDRSVTISTEYMNNEEVINMAKNRELDQLNAMGVIVDTSNNFDGYVILTEQNLSPTGRKTYNAATKVLNRNGLSGIQYVEGRPVMEPVAMFQTNINNMSTNRGSIKSKSNNTNFGQCKNNVSQMIYNANYDINTLIEQGIVPYNQTEYTRKQTTELLNKLKNDPNVVSANDIHSRIADYAKENGYTIHEADNSVTQMIPGAINKAFNHEGGVADCGGNKKKREKNELGNGGKCSLTKK